MLSRLRSLAQTHVMLIDKEWQGADLAEVVRTEMSPHADRVQVEGPKLVLSAKAAQNFALALHELATNAAKYGALSNADRPGGRRLVDRQLERLGLLQVSLAGAGRTAGVATDAKGLRKRRARASDGRVFRIPPRVDFAVGGVSYEINGSLDAVAADATHGPRPGAADERG